MAYRTPKHIQDQKDAKRKHILEKALEVFADKSFHETSIQDICKAAGVSVGSIYFYFSNKDEIYETVYSEIMANLLKASADAVKDEKELKLIVEKGIRATVTYLTSNPYIVKFFRLNAYKSGANHKRDEIFNLGAFQLKETFDKALKQGEISQMNTEMAAVTLTGSVYYLVRYCWNYSEGRFDVEEMTDFLIEYNLRGLGLTLFSRGPSLP